MANKSMEHFFFFVYIHELLMNERLLPQGETSGLHAANAHFTVADIVLFFEQFFACFSPQSSGSVKKIYYSLFW